MVPKPSHPFHIEWNPPLVVILPRDLRGSSFPICFAFLNLGSCLGLDQKGQRPYQVFA